MRAPLSRLSCLLSLVIASSAQAITLTFDDITNAACCNPVPTGYGGLSWSNFYVEDGSRNPNTGYANAAVSGTYVAFNGNGEQATTSGSPFDFTSVYLTAAWNNGLNVRVRGLNGGNVLYDNTVTVNTNRPTLFNFNYLGIDQLIFDSFGGTDAHLGPGGTHFAMDNMTINPVPEPGTALLLIAGLLELAGWRRVSA
jgi:hypothetical protein